jgi:hypothetical protein
VECRISAVVATAWLVQDVGKEGGGMYLIREIMYCKPGKVGEMIKKFKQMEPLMKEAGYAGPVRVMTDMSGEQFWTLVWEQEVDSLDRYLELSRQSMSDPRARKIMEGYHDLVEAGKREIYKIE